MKKFKFSLEKVLEVKEIEEKVIQKNLLLVQNQIYEIERKIVEIAEKISIERKNVSEVSSTVTKSTDIMLHYRYIESLSRETEICKDSLVGLRLKENEYRLQLIEKSREKKALEKLKEIKYEEFRKEYNKEQQLFIDDISIQNHRFKQGLLR